ncbi:MAG TPA: dihydrodipicolinate synthase family protein, partial [Microvirga sp.]|nr:dihydrodipicolinate synthase family protein [Microvirga sp.]
MGAGQEFVSWQVEQGSSAFAVNTALGEAPTLTPDERSRVIALVRESAGRGVPIIAGICTSCTAQGVAEALRAQAAGADALLLSAPPYNRPSTEGVLLHLESIIAATELPILVQNDPERTRVDLGPNSLVRLAARANVLGIVDGTGEVAAISGAHTALSSYTTRDALSAPFLMAGVVSALANITPRLCAQLHLSVCAGLFSQATAIQ